MYENILNIYVYVQKNIFNITKIFLKILISIKLMILYNIDSISIEHSINF